MKLSKECIEAIEKEYRSYCKKTGRNGGVLISQSIREVATHLTEFVLSDPSIYSKAGLISLEDALGFAEWCSSSYCPFYFDGVRWFSYNSNITESFTTAQLFQIYQEQKQK